MYEIMIRIPNGQMVTYKTHPTPLAALRAAEYADKYVDVIVMYAGREVPLRELKRQAGSGGYPLPGGPPAPPFVRE